MARAKIIKNFTIKLANGDSETIARAWQYGSMVYVPSRVGHWIYAQLYEVSSQFLIASWRHQPINGKVSLVKQCASELSELDWQRLVEQREHPSHDFIHPFVEQANAAIAKAEGRSLLCCPQCSENIRKAFSEHD